MRPACFCRPFIRAKATRLHHYRAAMATQTMTTTTTDGIHGNNEPSKTITSNAFFSVQDFEDMNDQMKQEDEQRENVIKRSREVLKSSKTAIYCLHRLELEKAEDHMKNAERVARELLPLTETYPHLRMGILTSSLEEWAEAKIFHRFLVDGTIPKRSDLDIVNVEEFLGTFRNISTNRLTSWLSYFLDTHDVIPYMYRWCHGFYWRTQ